MNHINDVLTFALVQITDHEYQEPEPLDWNSEVARFYRLLADIDKSLRQTVDAHRVPCDKLLQGPLSDAMLHLGQIGIFRRMAGSPVAYENYFAADIVVGKLRTTDK